MVSNLRQIVGVSGSCIPTWGFSDIYCPFLWDWLEYHGTLCSRSVIEYACLWLLFSFVGRGYNLGERWRRKLGKRWRRKRLCIYIPKHFFFLFFMYLSDRISKYHVINLKTVMKIDITLIIITVHYEYLKKNYTWPIFCILYNI